MLPVTVQSTVPCNRVISVRTLQMISAVKIDGVSPGWRGSLGGNGNRREDRRERNKEWEEANAMDGTGMLRVRRADIPSTLEPHIPGVERPGS